MKCIDADKLIAEVERTRDIAQGYLCGSERQSELSPNQYRMQGIETICSNLLSFIDSLQQEQPEGNLEEEVKSYIKDNFTITDEVAQIPEEDRMYSMGQDDMAAFAKHFYGLGLNARKRG